MRYASFGLVWREFGARLCDGDADVAARVDQSLVQGVDANDTGQAVVAPIARRRAADDGQRRDRRASTAAGTST